MWRPPILLAPAPPAPDDPAMATLLAGLVRATGASGCRLTLRLADGAEGVYLAGREAGRAPLVIRLEGAGSFRGEIRLYEACDGRAANPTCLEHLRPLIEGSLAALLERNNASRQIDLLLQIIAASDEANLLMDSRGDIVFANPRGEELLALHTERPLAQLDGDRLTAPLLSLIVAEIGRLQGSGERVRRQSVTTGDGGRWRLEVAALAAGDDEGYALVVVTPVRLPDPDQIRRRFADGQISRREAEVLAFVLRGQKACEIATKLGITEYTVKDHLKHAYAKLGISSRGQLLSRLAVAVPGAS